MPFADRQAAMLKRHNMGETELLNDVVSVPSAGGSGTNDSLISVVIPNHNKASLIEETLASLYAQTHSNWEAIIVDDSSTDNSWEIIVANAERDRRFRPFRNLTGKCGPSVCRNLGIRNVLGDSLLFLDSDDILAPSCLERRLSYLRSGEFKFVAFPMGTFVKRIGDHRKVWKSTKEHALLRFLAHDLPWQTMCPIFKTDYVRHMAGYDESFTRLEDVEFHTRCLFDVQNQFAVAEGEPDCFYRIDANRSKTAEDQILQEFVEGAALFLEKFHLPAAARGRRYATALLGTLYRALERTSRARASGMISLERSNAHVEHLLNTSPFRQAGWFKKAAIQCYLYCFQRTGITQPSGVSLVMSKLLVT